MGTTFRATMAKKSKSSRAVGALLVLLTAGAAYLSVPAQAQTSQMGGASAQQPLPDQAAAAKAAQSGQGVGPVVLPKDFADLRVAPGDLLSVRVYDTPEMTDSYRVDQAGNITLPLCGKVSVEGLSLSDTAAHIESALKNGQYLANPQVTVDVEQYAGQYVTVLGEVANPGRVPLIAPTTLGEILAQAGGVTPLAGGTIRIRHDEGGNTTEEDLPFSRNESTRGTAAAMVRPGDFITVTRVGIVYVLGAVNRPGGYVMQEDGKLNVAEALALSGGTVLTARTSGLRVIRRKPDGTVLDFALSYDRIADGKQIPLALEPEDIVYVPMSKIKATLTDTTAILSSAASASIYAATTH
jgi:polysaccharide biosynthesis/export protein